MSKERQKIKAEPQINNDKKLIYNALREGRCFIGYDLPHPTSGFKFQATSAQGLGQMGQEISFRGDLTLQIYLPRPAECCLIKDGVRIKSWRGKKELVQPVLGPGTYRIEAYLPYKGRRRTCRNSHSSSNPTAVQSRFPICCGYKVHISYGSWPSKGI